LSAVTNTVPFIAWAFFVRRRKWNRRIPIGLRSQVSDRFERCRTVRPSDRRASLGI